MRNTMEVGNGDRRRRCRIPCRIAPGERLRSGPRARSAGDGAGARALLRRDVAADGELGRRRRHDRTLDRRARDALRAARPASAARHLPRLVPPLGVGHRRDRPGRTRRLPGRGRLHDRTRPAACAARQRRRCPARLEPRPARERPRRRARREARRVPLATRGCRGCRRCSRRPGPRTAGPTRTRSARRGSCGRAGWPEGGSLPLGRARSGHARAGELLRVLGRPAGARPRTEVALRAVARRDRSRPRRDRDRDALHAPALGARGRPGRRALGDRHRAHRRGRHARRRVHDADVRRRHGRLSSSSARWGRA